MIIRHHPITLILLYRPLSFYSSIYYEQYFYYVDIDSHIYYYILRVLLMSFRDTFTRSQTSSDNLQYDDAAAYHFYTTMLILILIPISYSIIKTLKNPFGHIPKLQSIQKRPQFVKKIVKFKKQNRYNYLTCFFVFKIIVMALVIFGLAHCYITLQQTGSSMKGFDPYEILEVDPGTPVQKIKKSYRKLALKYHPDRNPGDPQANAKFIMISKAYECLTDQDAKQNCMKFGNPEGTASFNVGIALPSFLVKKQNQVVIMGAVFLLVVIILPIFLIYYFGEVNKYNQNGMLQDSQGYVNSILNEQLSIRDCVKVVSVCQQFKNLRTTRNQIDKLEELLKHADEDIKKLIENKKRKKKTIDYIKKSLVLVDARISEKRMPPELMEDFRYILKKVPVLLRASIMLAAGRSIEMIKRYRADRFVGTRAICSLVVFGQHYIQGLNLNAEPIQQLDLTDEQIDRIYKKKKKRKITDISELKNNSEDREFLLQLIGEPRATFIKQSLNYIPSITSLEAVVQVAGQSEITTMDVIQVIVRVNSQRQSTFCSAPKYPFLKLEGWYIIVEENNCLLNLEHFTFERMQKIYEEPPSENISQNSESKDEKPKQQKVIGQQSQYELKFNMRAPPQKGKYSLNVYVMSDCYFGVDSFKTFKYQVVSRKQTQETEVAPDHKDEDESLFTRMMKSMMPNEEEELSDKQD